MSTHRKWECGWRRTSSHEFEEKCAVYIGLHGLRLIGWPCPIRTEKGSRANRPLFHYLPGVLGATLILVPLVCLLVWGMRWREKAERCSLGKEETRLGFGKQNGERKVLQYVVSGTQTCIYSFVVMSSFSHLFIDLLPCVTFTLH